jgi:hypothetical protein
VKSKGLIGANIAFNYHENKENPVQRKGVLLSIRDCYRDRPAFSNWPTVRGQYLLLVQESNGRVRQFYDCNISGLRTVRPSLFSRVVKFLKGLIK